MCKPSIQGPLPPQPPLQHLVASLSTGRALLAPSSDAYAHTLAHKHAHRSMHTAPPCTSRPNKHTGTSQPSSANAWPASPSPAHLFELRHLPPVVCLPLLGLRLLRHLLLPSQVQSLPTFFQKLNRVVE